MSRADATVTGSIAPRADAYRKDPMWKASGTAAGLENYIFTLDPWCGWCVAEGPYVEGKRHGRWVSRVEDTGALHGKGSFVEGKKHGRWVEHYGRTIREYN